MKHSTQCNQMVSAKSDINSLFSIARICGMNSLEITDEFIKILAKFPRLPAYRKEFLKGVYEEKRNQLYRDSLVFGGFYNGVFYSTHSNRDDYYGKHGIEPVQWAESCHNGVLYVGHYWITTKEPKPF